ncbi:MAG: soxA1, partial [Phycisphaerales bacterium]|nr:soxA1 [Phycisphaerales bacterium]
MSSVAKAYDVIVVGVGAMGASACYHLAKRGVRVLGLERFDIPHGMGSYHGHSRMIRLAYFEHPDYVPLLRRSYALWQELADELGRDVIHITGGLMMGPPGATVLEGSLRSVREHGLPHDLLDAAEAMRRFPQFVIPDDYRVLHDHMAGLVLPERAVAGYAELAMRHGAELHGRERVVSWADDSRPARPTSVQTAAATYAAVRTGGALGDADQQSDRKANAGRPVAAGGQTTAADSTTTYRSATTENPGNEVNAGGMANVGNHPAVADGTTADRRTRTENSSNKTNAGGVTVRTDKGTYTAAKLIFCGGAWTDRLITDLGVPLTVTRQPMAWVSPRQPDLFPLGKMPVWIMEHRDGTNHYGFPVLPDHPGVKLATHDRTEPADAETLDRNPRPTDEAAVRWFLR